MLVIGWIIVGLLGISSDRKQPGNDDLDHINENGSYPAYQQISE